MQLTEVRQHIQDWATALDVSVLSTREEEQHAKNVVEILSIIPQWISVEDREPEIREVYAGSPLKSDNVLIFNGAFISTGQLAQTYGRMKKNPETGRKEPDPKTRKTRWEGPGGYLIRVTHWMPFPPKPEPEQPEQPDHHFLEYENGKCQCGQPREGSKHF